VPELALFGIGAGVFVPRSLSRTVFVPTPTAAPAKPLVKILLRVEPVEPVEVLVLAGSAVDGVLAVPEPVDVIVDGVAVLDVKAGVLDVPEPVDVIVDGVAVLDVKEGVLDVPEPVEVMVLGVLLVAVFVRAGVPLVGTKLPAGVVPSIPVFWRTVEVIGISPRKAAERSPACVS
jgi:hypothetical protein